MSRVEAAAKVIQRNHYKSFENQAREALVESDLYDAKEGVFRVRLDRETVTRVAKAMFERSPASGYLVWETLPPHVVNDLEQLALIALQAATDPEP